ncbi:hypothetical protein GPX89_02405 [Nocardia sp. ET3-3]|uniref:YbaB/EbfC family DNA-binding protein n=1 Tax=Nocardia terrae TaxID=2675851 RepID=A0A7K1UP33_9NOCA|nr:hypothetical protein [Nocardia terrae]MVU76094.1 hypothetical protein [Nocardia terrae]
MQEISDLHFARAAQLSVDEAELFQIALRTRIANATSTDHSVSIDVSADGTIYRWHLGEAGHRIPPDQLVATVIELIGKARNEARDAVHADFGLDPIPSASMPVEGVLARPPAAANEPVTAANDEAWDDDEDYYHRGKSRIAAD